MKKKLDKASVHNGRANSKGVAYNPNHNTLEASRIHQPHIDQKRIHLNQYLQYLGDGTAIGHRGGGGGYDSRKHELERYRHLYGEGLDARNQWYRASGHRERVKTMSQVYRDPKTAPMETIFQLGKAKTPKRLKANRNNPNNKPSKTAKNMNAPNKPLWKTEKEVGALVGESYGWCDD